MSVHAGSILTLGGNSVIDRIQSAGLGDTNIPIEVIREVGNRLIVDKVPGDPDFTFTLESLDVSTDLIAMLSGKLGAHDETGAGSDTPPGNADAAGTEYKWSACQPLSICSPWKSPVGDPPLGDVVAGHLVPGYYPTRLTYRYGVTDNAQQTVELGGGSFYYGPGTPIEEYATGDGIITDFVTSEDAIAHRKGGAGGASYRHVFGVLVNGQIMVEGVDFTVTGGANAPGPWTPATITFNQAPAVGALIRFAYFSAASHDFPQGVHASTVVKPGAVRGRNIQIYLGSGGSRQRIGGVQTYEQDSTVDGEIEREMGTEEPIGRRVDGFNTNGTLTVRARDADTFLGLLSKVTGVAKTEVTGYLNTNPVPLEVAITNPKNPSQTLKTIYVPDAIFQVPGTPARVNAPTDFALRFESQGGDFSEFKGAKP